MPSHLTAIGAISLEQKERYDILTYYDEWYILVYYNTVVFSVLCGGRSILPSIGRIPPATSVRDTTPSNIGARREERRP